MARYRGAYRVGTASWAIPRDVAAQFPTGGTRLSRYATRFDAVEINSSFYGPHRPATYARWADSVPDDFRFSVKFPKTITHERRLVDVGPLADGFLDEVLALGTKLGPLLIQLPPSLAFDSAAVSAFFDALRGKFFGSLACEPRHPTWFGPEADEVLRRNHVARVAADPILPGCDPEPGGWTGLAYFRLHGSPRMYYSGYGSDVLAALAAPERTPAGRETWFIFDNTAHGAATADALELRDRLLAD